MRSSRPMVQNSTAILHGMITMHTDITIASSAPTMIFGLDVSHPSPGKLVDNLSC